MSTRSTTRILLAVGLLGLVAMVAGTSWQFSQRAQAPTESGNRTVASLGTRSITLREVEQFIALPLYQVEQQRNQLLHQALQQLIDEELLEAEASRKGVTVSQLLIDASQSESIARLANLPAPVTHLSPGKTGNNTNLETPRDPQEQARLRQALLVALRRQANIHIDLPKPEPPILSVSADDDPSIGPANAPVTIVEFSDFQCPYCKLSVPLIKELLAKYPGKIKVVYRDYPGPNHPHAQQAAEAAQCAGDQGKFWEYHDSLFAHQAPGTGWNFTELAAEVELNQEAFTLCLNTGRYRKEVANDRRDGLTLGVTSTPTFFVNGHPLIGAQPLIEFQSVIDMLLNQHPLP